ncbi:MAG: ATP/GTP-binding protein [Methylovulum sp.]|nr:ATP/GTP-binding protein [Methylovulum sp.]
MTSTSTIQMAANFGGGTTPLLKPESNHTEVGMSERAVPEAPMPTRQMAQARQKNVGTAENPIKREVKIVVAGNVGSGKSTSIRAISDIPVIGTEAKATERDALRRKKMTTTAMEYGIAHIASTKLHLYGTPGQRRFDFMADILCKGASGMVVMIDNGCRDPLNEIDYYLNQHGNFLQKYPAVIAITHVDDLSTSTTLLDYCTYLLKNGFTCPVMLLDARNKQDVQKMLMKLLLQISGAGTGKQPLI